MLLGGMGVEAEAPLPAASAIDGGVQMMGDAAFHGESVSFLIWIGLWGFPLMEVLTKGGAGGLGGSPLMMGTLR
eukprot:983770-Amphidinium_carterae.1